MQVAPNDDGATPMMEGQPVEEQQQTPAQALAVGFGQYPQMPVQPVPMAPNQTQ